MKIQERPLGDLRITRAVEMIMEFDPLKFFPDTSAAQWDEHRHWLQPRAMNPENSALLLPCQSYIVKTSHHTVLIDSCVGNHKSHPRHPAWHQRSDSSYPDALAAHGLQATDIDFVMCTHLHGDHIGWNTRLQDGRWVPTFPNARYIFSATDLHSWQDSEQSKLAMQPIQESVLPVIAAGQATLVEDSFSLDDEIWLQPTPGHTPGHLAINLASRGQRAIVLGDMVHSPIQCLYPEWTVQADWNDELARKTRRQMMAHLAETQTLALTAHFPLPSAGWFRNRGSAFSFEYDTHPW